MLTNVIGWPLLRSRHKKRGYPWGRQSDAWTLSSSSMNTIGGEQTAHNVLVSCRGCLPMPRRWGKKNKNESHIEAAGTQSLGKLPRWKHWPSRWWDLGPQGRRSRGYTMRCINKRDYKAPPPYGPEWMEALDEEICASLEEQTQRRQGTTRPEEDLWRATVSSLWPREV